MAKYRVAVIGTVGKSVLIDDTLSSRVAKLETQIANVGGAGAHSALTGLQQGDDHPQYTMWAAPETIKALWNFQTVPYIQGEPLAEYIEDVVAGGSDPFISDSPSIHWTYDDTGNHLQADVVDEYIEDLVGSMLVNTTYIDLDYGDSDGSIKAILDTGAVLDLVGGQLQDSSTIDFTYDSGTKRTSAAVIALPAGVFANPSASIGLAAVNGSATTAMRSDAAPALSQTISPNMTGNWTFTPSSGNTKVHAGNLQLDVDNLELQLGASQDLRLYHDGTNSVIRNDTGALRFQYGTTLGASMAASSGRWTFPDTTTFTGAGTTNPACVYSGSDMNVTFVDTGGVANSRVFRWRAVSSRLLLYASDDTFSTACAALDITNSGGEVSKIDLSTSTGITALELDTSATAGNTRLLLYDVSAGALVRVSRGASDSGGAGFRVLRIPN